MSRQNKPRKQGRQSLFSQTFLYQAIRGTKISEYPRKGKSIRQLVSAEVTYYPRLLLGLMIERFFQLSYYQIINPTAANATYKSTNTAPAKRDTFLVDMKIETISVVTRQIGR